MSDGKLFQSRGVAAANVLSPKELCVRLSKSVLVLYEKRKMLIKYFHHLGTVLHTHWRRLLVFCSTGRLLRAAFSVQDCGTLPRLLSDTNNNIASFGHSLKTLIFFLSHY